MLEGDPAKSGPVTLRMKLPGGYKFPPHWHSMLERVTVLSGTFHAASGDIVDTNKGTSLGPAGLVVLSAKHHHYAWANGETVLQIHLNGPFDVFYVNAADDPRHSTASR
jgi:anti-sigma factor ChrR (cupin superfamily)